MNSFNEIKEKIYNEGQNIIVTAHVNPDGDSIGAGLSLTLALKKIGKNVRFILQDKYPKNIGYLNNLDLIEIYDPLKEYFEDLIICVDSATCERVGCVKDIFKNKFIINIDHHISNTLYGNYNYVEEISSTSEIIYKFLRYCGIEMDLDIAEALYTGLVNDTGNFTHDNVTFHTFEMASHLKKIGADSSKIVREFFNTKSLTAIRLLGKAMFEMNFDESKKLASYFISHDILTKYGAKKEETEGIVEKLLSLDKAEVSLFLREDQPGVIKGSMRSKHDIDVNIIANTFGGGGHRKASGFTSNLSSEEIIKIVLEQL